jgi:glycosyltransferase involved in cell wall biosynthesis
MRDELITQAQALGLSSVVRFEGFQSDVRPYLQSASAFILTSYMEGLPLSVLEAMACGLPCIVTDVGGNAEAVADDVVGFVIPPGSVDEAARAIVFLATHPMERATMSRMARQRVCRSFDIETRMQELIRTILT